MATITVGQKVKVMNQRLDEAVHRFRNQPNLDTALEIHNAMVAYREHYSSELVIQEIDSALE